MFSLTYIYSYKLFTVYHWASFFKPATFEPSRDTVHLLKGICHLAHFCHFDVTQNPRYSTSAILKIHNKNQRYSKSAIL